jgi:radical SAM superfamily enzyme YgiQ (UPF0313 family)
MKKTEELDCLLAYVPKMDNYYKPIGHYIFPMQLPMGLLALADMARRNNFKTEVIHLGIEKINDRGFLLEDYLKERKPKVVGLSLHWYYQSGEVINTARKIRLAIPDSIIVLGGITAGYYAEEIMEKIDCVDFIIKGEGEKPFLGLLKSIRDGLSDFSGIPNLTWRDLSGIKSNQISYVSGKEDMDGLNFANLGLLRNAELYVKYARIPWIWLKGLGGIINRKFVLNSSSLFPLVISRGCFTDCSCCGGGKIAQERTGNRRKLSIRSINRVIDSIRGAQTHNYDTIYISYMPFEEEPGYFEELFREIKHENIKVNCLLDCYALPNESLIRLFKATFLDTSKTLIHISPESGSENIRRINKGSFFDNQELIRCVGNITALKIKVNLSFSIGLPFETTGDIKITKVFQAALKRKFGKNINIFTETLDLMPASPMEVDPARYGIIKTRNSFIDILQSSRLGNSAFYPYDPGYFKNGFCISDNGLKASYSEETYRKELQGIRCRDFCRLSGLIGDGGPVFNRQYRYFLKLLCNIFCFYRELNRYIATWN